MLRAHDGSCGASIPSDVGQQRAVQVGEPPPASDDVGHPLQLLAADRRLDVGHPVVEPDDRVLLEDHLVGAVAHSVADAHPVLAQQSELVVDSALSVVSIPPSPVVITLRGWKEKQAIVAVWSPDVLPSAVPPDLAADGARGVLDDGSPCSAATATMRGKVARHAHLVDAEDRLGPAVIAASTSAGSMLYVSRSTSTNTGVAPQ